MPYDEMFQMFGLPNFSKLGSCGKIEQISCRIIYESENNQPETENMGNVLIVVFGSKVMLVSKIRLHNKIQIFIFMKINAKSKKLIFSFKNLK